MKRGRQHLDTLRDTQGVGGFSFRTSPASCYGPTFSSMQRGHLAQLSSCQVACGLHMDAFLLLGRRQGFMLLSASCGHQPWEHQPCVSKPPLGSRLPAQDTWGLGPCRGITSWTPCEATACFCFPLDQPQAWSLSSLLLQWTEPRCHQSRSLGNCLLRDRHLTPAMERPLQTVLVSFFAGPVLYGSCPICWGREDSVGPEDGGVYRSGSGTGTLPGATEVSGKEWQGQMDLLL